MLKGMRKSWMLLTGALVLALANASSYSNRLRAADQPSTVRLHALDCGAIDAPRMDIFSDTGEFDGKSGKLMVSCFLIRHPKGTLLWDTGLPDALAKQPGGITDAIGMKLSVRTTLASQLAELGLTASDIDYVAFSHLHGDHTGNANAFTNATWIVGKPELSWALASPTPPGVDPRSLSGHKRAKLQFIEFDHDLFGDGSVRILRTPGHTPGHQVLLLQLAHAGKVLLSGDLFHTRLAVTRALVPPYNVSRSDTLASIDRVLKLVKNGNARLVVQHALEDFAALPRFPAYLD